MDDSRALERFVSSLEYVNGLLRDDRGNKFRIEGGQTIAVFDSHSTQVFSLLFRERKYGRNWFDVEEKAWKWLERQDKQPQPTRDEHGRIVLNLNANLTDSRDIK